MILKKIDVAKDILNSQFGFAIDVDIATEYLGSNILNIVDKTLILIDFREVVFDHYFARVFGKLYTESKNPNKILDVVFQLQDFQKDDLLLGLLDFQNVSYSKDKDGNIQDFFIANNYSIKFISNVSQITFFSRLNEESKQILEFINQKLNTDFDELYKEKMLKNSADLSPLLAELISQRFIYIDSDEKYHSIYNYLKL